MREIEARSGGFESFRQATQEIKPIDVLGKFISKNVQVFDLDQTAAETFTERQAIHQLIMTEGTRTHEYENVASHVIPLSGDTEIRLATNGVEVTLERVEREDGLAWLKPKEPDSEPGYMTFEDEPLPMMERAIDVPRINNPGMYRVEPIYSMKFPIGTHIEQPSDPKDQIGHIFAAEAKKVGGFHDFRPGAYPDNRDQQQGFVRVLKRAALDIALASS